MGWTLDGFADKVRLMREAQRAFYRGRRKAEPEEYHRLLRASIDLEQEVDAALEDIAQRLPLFDHPLFDHPAEDEI